MSESVFWRLRPSATGRQIVMFPFLGGFGASFNHLVRNLDGDWDVWTVNPPGHGPSTEPPFERLDGLVDRYLEELPEVLQPDAVFFGHSMGGVVAYHVLLAMAGRRAFAERMPGDLVVSAARAPSELQVEGRAALPDRELLRQLLRFGAIPAEVAGDQPLIDMFLPAFRADYRVLEEVRRRPATRLHVRTRLILGGRDSQAPPSAAAGWEEYLADPVRVHVLDGAGHMFVLQESERLVPLLNDLGRVTAGPGTARALRTGSAAGADR